jgi:hypothetical protein
MTTPIKDHQSKDFIKLLIIGNSKSGKTGSLVSLVKAGYKLRILDLDNLLDILKYMVEKDCPQNADNVMFKTIRDEYLVNSFGPAVAGTPKAWIEATRMCDHWKDGSADLGKVSGWGPDCILVIDSLSRLCDAALDYHEAVIPRNKETGAYDGRMVYGNAQDAVEKFIATLTSDSMKTNVIVIAHVSFQSQPDGTIRGFPQGVGQKLSPKIPQYFPSVILYTNKNGVRTIQTNASPLIDLSNPKPFAMKPSYPIATGLADFFAVLRPPPNPNAELRKAFVEADTHDNVNKLITPPVKPHSLTLRRI